MHPGSHVLQGRSGPVILALSPELCQNCGLSALSLIRETEKSGEGGRRQSCCLWAKIPWWERKRETVHFCYATPVLLSPKFGAKSLHIFMQSQKVTVVYGIDCLGCQEEFFLNNPFVVCCSPFFFYFALWLQCEALWSWWSYLCVGHPQWMPDRLWTENSIQTPTYGSCFLLRILV
jgi:hypothetical protein